MKTCEFQNISRGLNSEPPSANYLAPPPGESFLRLRNKNFPTEIYRNTQTFAFQVLRECSFWASRNGTVQMCFMIPTRNKFAGKFLN